MKLTQNYLFSFSFKNGCLILLSLMILEKDNNFMLILTKPLLFNFTNKNLRDRCCGESLLAHRDKDSNHLIFLFHWCSIITCFQYYLKPKSFKLNVLHCPSVLPLVILTFCYSWFFFLYSLMFTSFQLVACSIPSSMVGFLKSH